MIQVDALEKSFKLYHHPAHRLREILLRRSFHTRYTALQDISFRVESGETLGIIGRNGAGKSTLLKILNQVLLPDRGTVSTRGRVTGLLELGTGFDFELNGLQNIRSNGLLLGMTEAEIAERRDSIIEFAELGEFIHEPLKTYSSGMTMRLAFAIAIHAEPDTFLIDEALSVGDGHFQQKCTRKISDFRDQGGSIIFVSHDMNAVKMLCDRVIVLDQGRIAFAGEPEEAVNAYYRIISPEDSADSNPAATLQGYGSLEVEITDASVMGEISRNSTLASGDHLLVRASITARESIADMTLGLMIRDRFGQDIFGTNSHHLQYPIAATKGEQFEICLRAPMRLAPGKYTITLALHDREDHTEKCYHWWDNALQFEVSGITGATFYGICDLNPSIQRVTQVSDHASP